MAIVIEILKQVAQHLLMSLLTRQFIEDLIIKALKWLAKKTDSAVDDELVAKVEEALKKSE